MLKNNEKVYFQSKFEGIPVVSFFDVPVNLGIGSVASTEPYDFADHDREDIEQIADILAVGFSRPNDLEALAESERKWREIAEHVCDVIIILDRESEIQFINHPAPA